VKRSNASNWTLLLLAILLVGCGDDTARLKAALQAADGGCDKPLRMEFYSGTWNRSLKITCDELKRGAWGGRE